MLMARLIRLEDVSFSYPAHRPGSPPALSGLNLSIEAGEFVAVIGANGSGKSTLARMLNALLLPDQGTVTISGIDTRDHSCHPLIRSRVGLVFQRPQDQIVAMTVEEDVAFGPANLGLPHGQVRERVELALAATGLEHLRSRPPYLLSAGETQRLALAGVLAMRPQCVIFDETTAMLDPDGRRMVLHQSQALQQQGICVILITHLMQEAAHAERVIVLHEGSLLMDAAPTQVFSHQADLHTAGLDLPGTTHLARLLHRFFPSLPQDLLLENQLLQALPGWQGVEPETPHAPAASTPSELQQPLIAVDGLCHTYLQDTPQAHSALNDVSMQVAPESIHCLIGGTGSGKSTLLQHLNGLLLPQSGFVRVAGMEIGSGTDMKILRRRVALAFQQPEDQIFEQYVGNEVAYGPRRLGYDGRLADIVRNAMEQVGLDFESFKDRLTSTLSGGEQRKVALASVLAVQADILLLDEPLAGLDPQSAVEMTRQMERLREDGTTLLISTHQYDELTDILDHASVLYRGHVQLHGSAVRVFSREQELAQAGLLAPLVVRAASALRRQGWPLQPEIFTTAQLVSSLDELMDEGET